MMDQEPKCLLESLVNHLNEQSFFERQLIGIDKFLDELYGPVPSRSEFERVAETGKEIDNESVEKQSSKA